MKSSLSGRFLICCYFCSLKTGMTTTLPKSLLNRLKNREHFFKVAASYEKDEV